jgi:Zn-dependent protease with chaperone function
MIDAIYYDGKQARRHRVTVLIHKRVLAMRGDGVRRNERLSKMVVSERLQHAPRLLRFPDGGFIEAQDHKRLDRMLSENRFKDPRVVRWQNNWPLSLLALVTLIVAILSAYQWGLPAAAEALARRVPASFVNKVGDDSFAVMDAELLKPSRLPAAYQQQLSARFAAMLRPRGEQSAYRLHFRSGRMGANAVALPNGVIVITDELIEAAGSDEAILGVLSHELGHVQRRHALRHLVQSAGIGIALNLWVGDVSAALAAAPAILLSQKNSRDFEREADRYAIDMMLANALPLEPLAGMFERFSSYHARRDRRAQADGADEDEEENKSEDEDAVDADEARRQPNLPRVPPPDYLASHPSDAERVATLRAAGRLRDAPSAK